MSAPVPDIPRRSALLPTVRRRTSTADRRDLDRRLVTDAMLQPVPRRGLLRPRERARRRAARAAAQRSAVLHRQARRRHGRGRRRPDRHQRPWQALLQQLDLRGPARAADSSCSATRWRRSAGRPWATRRTCSGSSTSSRPATPTRRSRGTRTPATSHEDHEPYLTVWIALDDVTEENGSVYLLPYSRSGIRSYIKHIPDPVTNDQVCYFGSDPGLSRSPLRPARSWCSRASSSTAAAPTPPTGCGGCTSRSTPGRSSTPRTATEPHGSFERFLEGGRVVAAR